MRWEKSKTTEKEVLFPELENVPLSPHPPPTPGVGTQGSKGQAGRDVEAECGREQATHQRLEM